MSKKLFGVFLLAGLLLPIAVKAESVSPAWEFSTVGSQGTNGNWTFGEVFTPNQDISVDYLGYYNPTTGMADSHPVGIFDAQGNLLASTIVDSGSTASSSHFLYNAITPIVLTAGDTYVIEGVSGIDPYAYFDNGFTVYAPITIKGNNDVRGGGLTFNGTGLNDQVSDGYWGADFGSGAPPPVPEPSSFLLLGSGLAGLAGLIKRKLKA